MNWFRFYNEAAGDFKVQLLEPPQFKDWVNLLCMASANEPRGYLSPIKQIAYVFRTSVADAQARVDMLISEGLFDVMEDGRIRPHNWDARQLECDDTATRRRAGREAEKARLAEEEEYQEYRIATYRALSYSDYLQTNHWQDVRARAHEADGHACRVCGSPDNLNVHHRTYERLGCEAPEDVVTLCQTCHQLFHDNGKLAKADA